MNKMYPSKCSMCVVVSPLRCLVLDQVSEWNRKGVQSTCVMGGKELNAAKEKDIMDGKIQLVFIIPEMLKAISSNMTRWPVALIAVNEIHCLTTWGKTFRSSYNNLKGVRARMSMVPILALTATATDSMITDVQNTLGIGSMELVQLPPNRPNIMLKVQHKATIIDPQWYMAMLVEMGTDAPKAIIFCRSIACVLKVYAAFIETSQLDDTTLEYYHAQLDEESEWSIPAEFKATGGKVRCLISTIAFGMGMQVADIRYVLHYGAPISMIDYFQEVGRGARDGSEGTAILYNVHTGHAHTEEMRTFSTRVRPSVCVMWHLVHSI